MKRALPECCRVVILAALLIVARTVCGQDASLVGHWRLMDDARDASGNGRHLEATDVEFQETDGFASARFNGRTSLMRLTEDSPQLGTGEFSVSLWVHTEAELDDTLGDLVSQYDARERRGFHLSLLNAAGVTSSQANYRNVHFGIDAGTEPGEWTDHGRLGNAVLIFCMAVHDGELFAGTCEAGADEAGRVFRFDGESWSDCGAPDECNAVCSMAEFDGQLYIGTGKYRLRGSSLTESENPHLGGNVFRYVADGEWAPCGRVPEAEAVNGMAVYRGRLYAGSMYAPAGFYRYDGDSNWIDCGTPGGKRVEALGVYNGNLYATGYDEGHVYRYNGEAWDDLGLVGEANQTYGFAVHGGELYVSEWPHARVYRLDGEEWTLSGRLGEELETMPLLVYNGKMYAGTLPTAEVYRFDGGETWTRIARLDRTPDVRYRRVWSMAQYRGRLFAGTLPSGHVHSIEIGRNVTYDHVLAPGWRHIAAVKESSRLRLYIDGRLVSTSTQFDAGDYNPSTAAPLTIGFGANDHFNGSLRDLRIYARALLPAEVTSLVTGQESTPRSERE